MSFGGYKFSGHIVDNTQYSSSIERCLAIHAARVRSFIEANNLANSYWYSDLNWLNGDIALDSTSWELTSGSSSGIIHTLKAPDNSVHGYSSYFKYSHDNIVGYYYIMTTDSYAIYNSSSGDPNYQDSLVLNVNTVLIDGSNIGPRNASCFHCLSLEPFGDNLFNLINTSQKSTRLQSIGRNSSDSGYQTGINSGFVGVVDSTTQYGYAIKDKDIIVFCGSGQTPFYTPSNDHVVVMSLEGFSELYNKNDEYLFLCLDIKNYNNGTDEVSSNYLKGWADQVLSTTGYPLISSSSTPFLVSVLQDVRSHYTPDSDNSVPFLGLVVAVYNTANDSTMPFSDSNQKVKGNTNPELIACNVSSSVLNNSRYSPILDGTLLFLYNMSSNSSYSSPNTLISGNSFGSNNGYFNGYYNIYIGWDPSNPDIRADAAWPEYNAVIPAQTVYSTMSY